MGLLGVNTDIITSMTARMTIQQIKFHIEANVSIVVALTLERKRKDNTPKQDAVL